MARKRKATHDPPGHSDNSNDPVAKKPKVNWSAIDDFQGFTVTTATAKAQKKLTNAAAANKHKNPTTGKPPKYPGQDAPLDANVVQSNPFPQTDLSQVHVKISPVLHWESTSRYRKFTINSEEFQVGQIVFVKNSEDSDDQNLSNPVEGWLAKILEIRAGDSSHVFLRVFWVYRPEDLPGGRQPHHGCTEVIVSNHMDVIEALTVQSLAETVYWDDDPDTLPLPPDQLFFRQSYDITKRLNPFSPLKKYCVDKQPINPDELLVQCSHCSEWLHAHCLEQEAIRNMSEAHQPTSTPLKKNNKRPKANGDNSALTLRFNAKLSASDTGKVRLTITDNHASKDQTQQWDVDISCLMCGKVIERADDSLPPTDPKPLSSVAEENESENVTVTINTKDPLPDDAAAPVSKLEPAPVAPAGTNAPSTTGHEPESTKKNEHDFATSANESDISLQSDHSAPLNTTNREDIVPPTIATTTTKASPTTNPVTTPTTPTTTTMAATSTAPSVSDSPKATHTPQPTPSHDSMLHSGVLSIKWLLWTE